MILYALVYCTMPFKDESFTRLKQNIMAGRYEPVPYPSGKNLTLNFTF